MFRRLACTVTVVILAVVANGFVHAGPTVPVGLLPGEVYHLAFVTSGTRDASSSAIADYNLFVNDQDVRSLNGEQTAIKDGDTLMILPSIAGGAI